MGRPCPPFYENRGERLRIVDPALNERIARHIAAVRQAAPWTIPVARLRKEFTRTPFKHLVTLSLKERSEARLAAMLGRNPTRIWGRSRPLSQLAGVPP